MKLIWTREEDIAQGMFRPQSFQCVEAATDASGKVTGWKHCVVGDGEFLLQTGIRIPYYGVPNQFIERRGVSHGVKLKHWRAVGHVFNVFAIESMVDRMAADQGMDPIEFRFEKMGASPKARKVFEALAQMSDYKAPRPAGQGGGHLDHRALQFARRGRGRSVARSRRPARSACTRSGWRWTAASSCSPSRRSTTSRARSSTACRACCTSASPSRTAGCSSRTSTTTTLMRMSDLPEEMHVKFVDVDTRPTGLGEIGNPFIAPAIANAVFRLTGKRLEHLPFTPDRVLATLKA